MINIVKEPSIQIQFIVDQKCKAFLKYQDGSNVSIKAGVKNKNCIPRLRYNILNRRIGFLSIHDYEFEFNCHASQEVHWNFNTGNVVTLIRLILPLYIQRFLPLLRWDTEERQKSKW